jgi:hypothetical protein
LELPFTAAHRAVGTRALRVHPLENTVQMKCVIACSPYCSRDKRRERNTALEEEIYV